jgi:riboflavin kinase
LDSSRLNTNPTVYLLAANGELWLLTDKHEWQRIQTLLKLAEMGAHRRTAKISTEYLAEKMGISQQTASRHLIELEHKRWITRTITPEGSLIKIDDLGIKELKKLYAQLRFLVEAAYPPSVTLEGTVFTGLGEGAYYISKDVYRKQFIEKLGFDPYPGTLNLKLTTEYDLKTRTELETYPAVEIEGFKNENRTFGVVKCYPATIDNKVKGALIFALRSHYDVSVLEVIAPVCLRKQLNLNDGHKVKVEVFTLP